MVDEANEDYIYYGTPIEREEELSAGHKRKMTLDAGQMRRLPPWKQEVTDEEGRRRFHGAFTGGFSAGFYNTVGSKEGWAPRTFTSSRKNRSEAKGQTVYSFLDDDEKAEFEARELSSSSQFDTFGFTAAEVARKQAEKELQTRPSAIPGPVPDEIIAPVAESIGVKLLVKMGWRHGRSIGASDNASISESRREARKAFLAFAQNNELSLSPNIVLESQPPMEGEVIRDEKTNELERDVDAAVQVPRSTPVFVIHPKNDLYGLGYDPFKNAPEFRERYMHMSQGKETGLKKIGRLHGSLFRPNAGKTATGFGIGALEDIEEEDEDIYSSGGGILVAPEEEVEEPSHRLERRKERTVKTKSHDGVLPGFKLASVSTCRKEWFIPSTIPPSFVPRHKFSVPLEVERKFFQLPPPEAAPPHDSELCMMIEGLATFVARSGKIFEDISREKNTNNPLFCFLFGGPGHDYYRRKLWEEQKKLAEQGKVPIEKSSERMGQKLNSEDRGRVLGERPLEKSSDSARKCVPSDDVDRLQSILFDTFTKPASLLDGAAAVQPFQSDPAKQARFEQFLKDKYQGGLRSCYVGDDSRTEIERAQERLDFEAAVEITEKGSQSQKNSASVNENLDLVSTVGTRFTSGGIETMDSMHQQQRGHENGGKTETKQFPQREEHQWRPSLLLCKRFNLLDPYVGKPPPLPKARSKMDSLILISNPVRDLPETSSIIKGRYNLTEKSVSQSQLEAFNPNEVDEDKEEVVEANDAVVKKPVDLYKAIFSDESDNEEEENTEKQLDSHEKSAQGANATLNRLIAGDFLESLGKELGLKVPKDLDGTEKGKDVPLVSKESKKIGGETAAGNGISMLAKSSSQKAFEWNPNPKSRMYGSVSSSIKNEEKEADAYEIGETQAAKGSGFKEENTIWHESGKSDYLGKSSTHDAVNNSSSDYDRGKENIMERKRKREPTRERRKSHSKRHHKREHRSRDDYTRKKRDKDKESCDHKKHKNRKRRRRDSSLASSSSEPSHES